MAGICGTWDVIIHGPTAVLALWVGCVWRYAVKDFFWFIK
jgi:hypothetical protein